MNQAFMVGELGNLFAYDSYPSISLAPLDSVLYLSVCGAPVRSRKNGINYAHTAYASGPARTELRVQRSRVVGFNFFPKHPLCPAIRRATRAGAMVLSRDAFASLDERMAAACQGELNILEAKELYQAASDRLEEMLPANVSIDDRVTEVLKLLDHDQKQDLRTLSSAVRLSPDRLSHLFSDVMAISLRHYRMSLNLGKATTVYRPSMAMTDLAVEAGFTDASHLGRVFKAIYGASPGFFIRSSRIHAHQ